MQGKTAMNQIRWMQRIGDADTVRNQIGVVLEILGCQTDKEARGEE